MFECPIIGQPCLAIAPEEVVAAAESLLTAGGHLRRDAHLAEATKTRVMEESSR
jgi:hypothetical protein